MRELHGGNIYAASIKYNIPKEKLIDFSANINPLGFPAYVKKYIGKHLGIASNYPDPEQRYLKDAVSKYLRIPTANILIGNGSTELIYLIPKLFTTSHALILGPTFSEYEKAVKTNEGTTKYFIVEEKFNFRLDFNSILPHARNADIIFICNPNNPTGTLYQKDEIKDFIKKVSKKTLIVIDEAFMDFVTTPRNFSLINDATRIKNILIIRSFTKFFAMAGFRLGFIIGHRDLIARLKSIQYPWSVNTFAQLLAAVLTKDKKFIKKSADFMKKERVYLYSKLGKFKNIIPFRPTSNFIFCKIKNMTSAKLTHLLGKRGILIRKCSNFYGLDDKFIRVAVKKRADNLKLLEALRCLNR